eukprot:jgi/Bigna1/70531/fgenesh1_pg.12_\
MLPSIQCINLIYMACFTCLLLIMVSVLLDIRFDANVGCVDLEFKRLRTFGNMAVGFLLCLFGIYEWSHSFHLGSIVWMKLYWIVSLIWFLSECVYIGMGAPSALFSVGSLMIFIIDSRSIANKRFRSFMIPTSVLTIIVVYGVFWFSLNRCGTTRLSDRVIQSIIASSSGYVGTKGIELLYVRWKYPHVSIVAEMDHLMSSALSGQTRARSSVHINSRDSNAQKIADSIMIARATGSSMSPRGVVSQRERKDSDLALSLSVRARALTRPVAKLASPSAGESKEWKIET